MARAHGEAAQGGVAAAGQAPAPRRPHCSFSVGVMLTTMPTPSRTDLAAHPDFELTRDRQAREWGDVGEENQDYDTEEGA